MSIVLGGTNYKTSPLWLREKAALSGVSLFDTRKRLLSSPGISEVVVVSTCHRVEFYVAGKDPDETREFLRGFLMAEYGLGDPDMDKYFYFSDSAEAVKHLMMVAAGVDSMVVGETQVTGQVQHSCDQARLEGTLGPELDRLLKAAADTAKRVRAETGFCSSPVTIGSVAVDMAKDRLGSLKNRAAMILGAGEMGILTARALSAHGIATILVANRTLSRAQEIAHSVGGRAVDYSELLAQIEKVDVLVTSTSAPHVLIKAHRIEQVIKQRLKRPLFIIDLAMPRNVDPGCAELAGVVLVNVDDLQEVADTNTRERLSEKDKVMAIISEEIDRFLAGEKKQGFSLLDLALG